MNLLDAEVAFAQIDPIVETVARIQPGSGTNFENVPAVERRELRIRCEAAIERLAPVGSSYVRAMRASEEKLDGYALTLLVGILKALRKDYEAGHLRTLRELVHADLFSDFLDMAGHLLENGFKGPAGVVAGSVLEGHLRKIAEKASIDALDGKGRPKSVELLGADLVKAAALSELDRKHVTAWYGLRTKAAHGHGDEIVAEQVGLMIEGVRDFVRRNPA